MFGVTIKPTPLFSTGDLTSLFALPLPLSGRYLLEEVEVVLFPHTEVAILSFLGEDRSVVEVQSPDYPSKTPLYTHIAFLDTSGMVTTKKRVRPSRGEMIDRLERFAPSPYVWGGNFAEGVPDLLKLFPPSRPLQGWEWINYHLRGVDCSGLLYRITEGTVPRNTGPLWEVCDEIDAPSSPLDLIFVPGHVLIVLSCHRVIESRHLHGVCISSLDARLRQLKREEEWVKFGRCF